MSCDPNDLSELAKCFQCLDPQQAAAIELYLLTLIAGISPDVDSLLVAAKDFQGLNEQQNANVQAYLLCKISGG